MPAGSIAINPRVRPDKAEDSWHDRVQLCREFVDDDKAKDHADYIAERIKRDEED